LPSRQENCIWSFVARVGSSRCRSRINIGISEVCFSSKGGDFTPSVVMFDSGANPRAAQSCFSGSNFRTLIPNAITPVARRIHPQSDRRPDRHARWARAKSPAATRTLSTSSLSPHKWFADRDERPDERKFCGNAKSSIIYSCSAKSKKRPGLLRQAFLMKDQAISLDGSRAAFVSFRPGNSS
jgi:hypothetical protein